MSNNQYELQDAGVMTEPFSSDAPIYDFRKLLAYCKEKQIKPENLTDTEYKRFQVNESGTAEA